MMELKQNPAYEVYSVFYPHPVIALKSGETIFLSITRYEVDE